VSVAVSLGDIRPARRITAALDRNGDLEPIDAAEAAEVLITDAEGLDQARPSGASVVLLGRRPSPAPTNLRASLPEDTAPDLIAGAARLVAAGLSVFPTPPEDAEAAGAEQITASDPQAVTLTPREREVLELLAVGASNKAIARTLDISVHTAKFHVASLLEKLQASGRLEAVGIGLRTGLLML